MWVRKKRQRRQRKKIWKEAREKYKVKCAQNFHCRKKKNQSILCKKCKKN